MFLFLFLYTVYGLVKKKKEMANKDFERFLAYLRIFEQRLHFYFVLYTEQVSENKCYHQSICYNGKILLEHVSVIV